MSYIESLPCLWELARSAKSTNTVTLKYHFVSDSLDVFLGNNNFIWDQNELVFVEVFKDTNLFSEMRASRFRKDIFLVDDKKARTFHKSSFIQTTILPEGNTLRFCEKIINLDESSKEKNCGVELEILVTRRVYTHNINKMIKITYDECEFPDGDCFSVCAFVAQVPEEMEKEIIESLAKHKPNIDQQPTRSKIIEYLYRYHPKVYSSLLGCNKLIQTDDTHFKSTFLGKHKFHPLSKITSFFSGEIKKLDTYLKNCLEQHERTHLNNSEMASLYRICRHYSPATNKALQNTILVSQTIRVQQEILDKIHVIRKLNWLFYQYYEGNKSHFEIFVSPDNICKIEQLFESEISAGSVRVSSSIRLLEVAFGKLCDPELISRAETEFTTYSSICQLSICTLLSNNEQIPDSFIEYQDYSKKTRRITNSRLAKLSSKQSQTKPNWVPCINTKLHGRLTSALQESQISLFELVISYPNFFVRVHISHNGSIEEIERMFSAEIEKGIIRVVYAHPFIETCTTSEGTLSVISIEKQKMDSSVESGTVGFIYKDAEGLIG